MPVPTRPQPWLRLDAHADTPQRFADEGWHFTDDLHGGHLNLSTARASGLSGQFFAIWPEPRQWRGHYAHRTLHLIDAVHEEVRRCPVDLVLCRSVDDLLAAHETGQFAILLGIEGGHAIENSLALLRQYFALGVRYMTLTWANSNEWADSSGDFDDSSITHHGGLTPFGQEVVREMNRLGMMVDVSHVSDATFADVLRISTAPVIASHSSARALTAAPRNLTDDMIRAIAARDGAVLVNFYPAFLDETWRSAWNALAEERDRDHHRLQAECDRRGNRVTHALANAIDQRFAARLPLPPLSTLIDHIDHICKVAGHSHVGFGSDFDGICALPAGLDSAADLPKIEAALRHRGYTDQDLRGILGENLLHVMRLVESLASSQP
jgi:membrane dipeptidase